MARSGGRDFFNKFNRHTRLKHFALETYLFAWASILFRFHSRIWFVDAFAGEGKDEEGNPGSPLIACTVATKIQSAYKATSENKEFRVVAIESNKNRFKVLQKTLAPFTGAGGCAKLIRGNAWEGLEQVLAESNDEPLIAFIDPFGVKGLSIKRLAQLLAVKRREALILFNDVGANRLHASSKAKPKRKPDLGIDMFASLADGSPTAPDEPEATLEDFAVWQAKHRDHLIEAFGEAWPGIDRELQTVPENQRRQLLADRYVDTLKAEAGALYAIPMSITDEKGKHHYQLVHASTNSSAVVAMKKSIHKVFTDRDREANSMFPGMSAASVADIEKAAAKIVQHFAGRAPVRWDGGDDKKDTVFYYMLAETEALVADRERIREQLKRYKTSAKYEEYKFPKLAES